METIFKSSKEFEAALHAFDLAIRAKLQAVIDNFEEVWDKATSTADIPRAFDFKALHGISGNCRSYQIRGVNKKHRFTMCQVPVRRGEQTTYWTTVWAKHSANDRHETHAANRICKRICDKEASYDPPHPHGYLIR